MDGVLNSHGHEAKAGILEIPYRLLGLVRFNQHQQSDWRRLEGSHRQAYGQASGHL